MPEASSVPAQDFSMVVRQGRREEGICEVGNARALEEGHLEVENARVEGHEVGSSPEEEDHRNLYEVEENSLFEVGGNIAGEEEESSLDEEESEGDRAVVTCRNHLVLWGESDHDPRKVRHGEESGRNHQVLVVEICRNALGHQDPYQERIVRSHQEGRGEESIGLEIAREVHRSLEGVIVHAHGYEEENGLCFLHGTAGVSIRVWGENGRNFL